MQVMQRCPLARERGMTRRARRDSVRPTTIVFGSSPMPARACVAVIALALSIAGAGAQAPTPSDAAKDMVGAWEISNAARDKTCPLTFKLDPGAGGFKLELDEACGSTFPSLKDVGVWTMGPNDEVRLLNSKGAVILDFMEVEAHMYEAERKGEGLFFMRTQDAIKAATVTPGCDPSVADVELSTWQLGSDGLLLTGRGGSWRFSESDATTWERIPA